MADLTGSCERCRARDGRSTSAYELIGKGLRELCDDCARATEQVHKLKPSAPAVEREEAPAAPARPRRGREVPEEAQQEE